MKSIKTFREDRNMSKYQLFVSVCFLLNFLLSINLGLPCQLITVEKYGMRIEILKY